MPKSSIRWIELQEKPGIEQAFAELTDRAPLGIGGC